MELSGTRLFSDRALLRIMVPLIIEQILANLVGLCDGIMVSDAGEAAISGVSLVNMICGVVLVLFAALSTGGAVLTSQYWGAGQKENAKKSAEQMVLMSLVFSIMLMNVCLIWTKPILRLFFVSVEDDVMEASMVYFRYNAGSFPFIALYNAGAAIFRSRGNSKISMRISFVTNIINIAGNAICIYGFHMGVAGVAIPTVVGRIVGAVLILVPACDTKQDLSISLKNMRHIHGGMMRKIVGVGIPTAFENSLLQVGRVLVLSLVSALGTVQITATATATSLSGLVIFISQGMSLGTITVVGQCLGARDPKQAMYYTKKLLLWCYAVQGTLQLLMLIFRLQAVALYSNLSPETVALTEKLLAIFMMGAIPIYPLSFMLPSSLRAANSGRYTMIVSVLSMVLCRILLAWILCIRLGWGVTGVWIAMVMDWGFRSLFFAIGWFSGKWEKHCYLT